MSKVVDINGEPYAKPRMDSGVASIVEDIYHQARSGVVSGIAVVVMVDTDDGYDVSCSFHGPRISLLGGIARLNHKINNDLDSDHSTPPPKVSS